MRGFGPQYLQWIDAHCLELLVRSAAIPQRDAAYHHRMCVTVQKVRVSDVISRVRRQRRQTVEFRSAVVASVSWRLTASSQLMFRHVTHGFAAASSRYLPARPVITRRCNWCGCRCWWWPHQNGDIGVQSTNPISKKAIFVWTVWLDLVLMSGTGPLQITADAVSICQMCFSCVI